MSGTQNSKKEVLSPGELEIQSFKANFDIFCQENADQFDLLETALARCNNPHVLEELYDECADDLKGILGSNAANKSSDRKSDQDNAISFCESWISNNELSNIGVICWIQGRKEGIKEIEKLIRSASKRRPGM